MQVSYTLMRQSNYKHSIIVCDILRHPILSDQAHQLPFVACKAVAQAAAAACSELQNSAAAAQCAAQPLPQHLQSAHRLSFGKQACTGTGSMHRADLPQQQLVLSVHRCDTADCRFFKMCSKRCTAQTRCCLPIISAAALHVLLPRSMRCADL